MTLDLARTWGCEIIKFAELVKRPYQENDFCIGVSTHVCLDIFSGKGIVEENILAAFDVSSDATAQAIWQEWLQRIL
jgi:hypothetical protein